MDGFNRRWISQCGWYDCGNAKKKNLKILKWLGLDGLGIEAVSRRRTDNTMVKRKITI